MLLRIASQRLALPAMGRGRDFSWGQENSKPRSSALASGASVAKYSKSRTVPTCPIARGVRRVYLRNPLTAFANFVPAANES